MLTKKPRPRKVTRAEHQRFVERLTGRSGADKLRLLKEHIEYIDGVRVGDADFGDAAPGRGRLARDPRRPPAGKGGSCLKANQRFISEQRRNVAAKILEGSDKSD
ncbi:hypothetical protein PHMEG_00020629 [Phytophthora megakarya]|uniref:Uncharacterized protein n=1 Tax=Phytophthora megakarya TaxID=4795 RepID=A0A225VNM8_9STRA|nr:hypothetical protein PHMEG_00020629 [Phytophthora megakarya]